MGLQRHQMGFRQPIHLDLLSQLIALCQEFRDRYASLEVNSGFNGEMYMDHKLTGRIRGECYGEGLDSDNHRKMDEDKPFGIERIK
jgi:hypothetical protein